MSAGVEAGGGELIPSVSIANLLQQRDAIAERIAQATALLVEADSIAREAQIRTPSDALTQLSYNRDTLVSRPEAVLASIDASLWERLLRETGLRTFMDATAREAWQKQINERQTPPLTRDNIEATFTSLYDARESMFERGVLAIFRRLSWHYKTNTPVRFGKRIIVTSLRSHGFISQQGTDALDDLVRAFCILDRVPEPDHRCAMSDKLRTLDTQGIREWEGPFFHIRWFLNGNGHVTFRRPELVDRLNAILAKHHPGALPAGRA